MAKAGNLQNDIRDVIEFYDKKGFDWSNVVCFLSWKYLGEPCFKKNTCWILNHNNQGDK